MTTRLIRKKEMDMDNNIPSEPTEKPEPAIADHTHDEYDQLLVKFNELEQRVAELEAEETDEWGENEEENVPEQGEYSPQQKLERMRKRREDVKGVPERGIGKKSSAVNPTTGSDTFAADKKKGLPQIPQTEQPAVGKAPGEGKTFAQRKDVLGEEEEKDAEGKAAKPKSEYDKPTIVRNKMDEARRLVEQAKVLMREAEEGEEDPTRPQPGEVKKNPEPMDMAAPYSSIREATEDEEDKENEDEEDEEKKEARKESWSRRQSVVGAVGSPEGRIIDSVQTPSVIKEYLKRAGFAAEFSLVG